MGVVWSSPNAGRRQPMRRPASHSGGPRVASSLAARWRSRASERLGLVVAPRRRGQVELSTYADDLKALGRAQGRVLTFVAQESERTPAPRRLRSAC